MAVGKDKFKERLYAVSVAVKLEPLQWFEHYEVSPHVDDCPCRKNSRQFLAAVIGSKPSPAVELSADSAPGMERYVAKYRHPLEDEATRWVKVVFQIEGDHLTVISSWAWDSPDPKSNPGACSFLARLGGATDKALPTCLARKARRRERSYSDRAN